MTNRMFTPGKKALPWLLAMALGITGAGAAIGTVLSGNVTGNMPTAVSQAIVIDKDNFDIGDLSSHAARRFVGVSDDSTSFIAAAELSTGEELVINLPLGNNSDQDALALFTLDVPSPLQAYVREFWDTTTKTDTPSAHYLTTPSPAPVTSTASQIYDNTPLNDTNSKPSGSVNIDYKPANLSQIYYFQPNGAPMPQTMPCIDSTPFSVVGANLIQNGSFESGPGLVFTTDTGYKPSPNPGNTNQFDPYPGPISGTMTTLTAVSAAIPSWTVIDSPAEAGTGGVDVVGTMWQPQDGSRSLDLGGGITSPGWGPGAGGVEQTFVTTPLQTYEVSFWMGANPNWYGGWGVPVTINAQVASGGPPFFSVQFPYSSNWAISTPAEGNAISWERQTFSFTATGPTTTLSFVRNAEGVWGPTLDNVRVTAAMPPPYPGLPSSQSNTWYVGWFDVDIDGNGATENLWFGLTDTTIAGTYDTMDISISDPVNPVFGETANGTLIDGEVETGDDERFPIPAAPPGYSIQFSILGYEFYLNGVASPSGAPSDATIRSTTWFLTSFNIDIDADASDDDPVAFCLTDFDSDGRYDTLDISTDDGTMPGTTFGDGTLSGQNPRQTGTTPPPGDDERLGILPDPNPGGSNLGSSAEVRLGDYYLFTVEFDNNPPNDTEDIRITSKTWYTGDFTIDADGDEVADDTLYFALSDSDSDGLYDRIDLSISDQVFGETGSGTLSDDLVNYLDDSNNDNDELDSWSASGNFAKLHTHWFLVEFDKNPPQPGNIDDTKITARWYVGTYNVDIDGDQVDDVLDFVLVDTDSDGLFTIMNLDCNGSGSYTTSSPDEEFASGDYANLDGQSVQVTFPLNPLLISSTLTDGRIITVTRRNDNQWLLLVPATAEVGGVQDQIKIKIAHPDDGEPEFFKVTGVLEQYEPQKSY